MRREPYRGKAYRAIDPKWAFGPLSGDGAAISGGRFNPKGVSTLYLSLDPVTAINEMSQGFSGRIAPSTLCEYEIDCIDVVYLLTAKEQAAAGTSLADLGCAWKLLTSAPSQKLAERLIASGAAGIVVPSFAVGALPAQHNLVLWKKGPDLPYKVEVFDPTGRLPRDQLSWP